MGRSQGVQVAPLSPGYVLGRKTNSWWQICSAVMNALKVITGGHVVRSLRQRFIRLGMVCTERTSGLQCKTSISCSETLAWRNDEGKG